MKLKNGKLVTTIISLILIILIIPLHFLRDVDILWVILPILWIIYNLQEYLFSKEEKL